MMKKVLALICALLVSSIGAENYALKEEDDCFALGFHTLLHSDVFSADSAFLSFVSSFSRFVSLELAGNAPDAFQGYTGLATSSLDATRLSAVKKVMDAGCECKMAISKKDKKGKKGKKRTEIDETCPVSYAYYFLGTFFKRVQAPDEALPCFLTATNINSAFGEAYTQAGTIYMDNGENMKALPYLKRAVELFPQKFFTHYYYALALTALHRNKEADEMFEKAVSLGETGNEKFNTLIAYATTVHKSGRRYWNKAEELYRRTLDMAPSVSLQAHAKVQSHYGVFLKDKQEYNRSIAYLTAAITQEPSECGYRLNLGHAYEARRGPGDTAAALEQYISKACMNSMRARCEAFVARQKVCAWAEAKNWTDEIVTISGVSRYEPCITPAMAVFSELSVAAETELAISKLYAGTVERRVRYRYEHSPENFGVNLKRDIEIMRGTSPSPTSARVNIGYISAYFYDHIVGFIFEKLLPLHDNDKFDVYLYVLNAPDKGDGVRKKLESLAKVHFVDISLLDPSEAAERINDDKILILINLDGHLPGMDQEILARLPAPVQINFLGFPGSSGSNYTHYIVADRIIIPPTNEFQKYYTEKIIYMPHSYLPTHHVLTHSNLTMKSAERQGGFTFCSLNQLIKLDPVIYKTWQQILKRVPNSVLWLQKHPEDAVAYLKKYAPDSNIIFLDRNNSVSEYMAQLKQCDLFLDPLKYNSHTTGADSLWMGVPLLSLPGSRFSSRVGTSLIHSLGCSSVVSELIAHDLADYEEKAVSLASDHALWKAVQERIGECARGASLFDLDGWVKAFERGLLEVVSIFVHGKNPEHILL